MPIAKILANTEKYKKKIINTKSPITQRQPTTTGTSALHSDMTNFNPGLASSFSPAYHSVVSYSDYLMCTQATVTIFYRLI